MPLGSPAWDRRHGIAGIPAGIQAAWEGGVPVLRQIVCNAVGIAGMGSPAWDRRHGIAGILAGIQAAWEGGVPVLRQ